MNGKAILISGGFGILGRALAESAVKAGAKVALVDRADAPADLPEGVIALGGVNLIDPAGSAEAASKAHAALGGLDGVANVAGGFTWITASDATADDWKKMFELNVATAVNLSKAALPYLKQSKRCPGIVNIAAKGALSAAAGMGPYAASKAGVLKLTEAMAEELKADGIRINAVLPSIIDTPQNRADMPKSDPGKWVAPADLSAVILFLLSDAAFAVTGAQIVVTGRV